MDLFYRFLFATCCILSVLDVYITYQVAKIGGREVGIIWQKLPLPADALAVAMLAAYTGFYLVIWQFAPHHPLVLAGALCVLIWVFNHNTNALNDHADRIRRALRR